MSTMEIVKRTTVQDRFLVISNGTARGTNAIGRLKALPRCILFYLLSLPPGWQLKRPDLDAAFVEGRDAITAALRDLEHAGYLQRERGHAAGGQWVWKWHVTDTPLDDLPPRNHDVEPSPWSDVREPEFPQVTPSGGYPSTVSPSIKREEGSLTKTDTNTDSRARELPETAKAKDHARTYPESFEAFWQTYGRRGSKATALTQWRAAVRRSTPEVIMAAVREYVAATPDLRYRKHAERWLRDDGWESVVVPAERPEDDPVSVVIEALKTRTGKVIERPHAERLIKFLMEGRQVLAGNVSAYLRAAIERDRDPSRFLPTPVPPRYERLPRLTSSAVRV